jgi:dTDP-4-amino-4,6-dideoxygalactose transaminase
MRIIQAPRASAILYNLLASRADSRPWLLPANICPIVPLTFFKAGVPFDLVDISAETLHMDLEQAEGRLRRGGYGGLLYAHTYAEPSTPTAFFQSIKSRHPDVLLVDDRCLCAPDLEPDVGMEADVALYSTGYAKIVDFGLGGYAFLKDEILYRPSRLPFAARDHVQVETDYKRALQERAWFAYQDSDWLQTDADLPPWSEYRRRIEQGLKDTLAQRVMLNAVYAALLPVEVQLPPAYQTWRFNVRVKNRERVLAAIFKAGLFASSHYVSLAGIMVPGHCPNAEALAGEIVNLFNDHHFDPQKAQQVCAVILENLP